MLSLHLDGFIRAFSVLYYFSILILVFDALHHFSEMIASSQFFGTGAGRGGGGRRGHNFAARLNGLFYLYTTTKKYNNNKTTHCVAFHQLTP